MATRIEEAYEIVSAAVGSITGRFYVQAPNQSPGAGVIYTSLRYPVFLKSDMAFATAAGLCLVLTHECDVAVENTKAFNDSFLVCPIIPFETFVSEIEQSLTGERFKSYFSNLVHRRINQLMYIPVYSPIMPMGGILHLNRISFSNIEALGLDGVRSPCWLSRDGLQHLDAALANSLLRPKADNIPPLH